MVVPPVSGFMGPFYPPIDPYRLPNQAFDNLIENTGERFVWMKNHTCPCMYAGEIPGSPDPSCLTCGGRGIYWDQPSDPFHALFIYVSRFSTQSQPGAQIDTDQGLAQNAEPSLTIPQIAGLVWQEASIFDIFVEIDASTRFNAQLQVGNNEQVPYQQQLVIAASGAVTIWDPATTVVQTVSGYTVSGASVFLPSGYAVGTNYIVDFIAAPAFVAYRSAGAAPHIRPFGRLPEPRRFQLQLLDYWLRARGGNSDIPVAPFAP